MDTNTIKNELERYLSVKESDIDIHVKEKMLIAYIPLAGNQDDNTDNRYMKLKMLKNITKY